MSSGRWAARAAILALVTGVVAACGGPETNVVDSYFKAVNSKDHQTLQSFASVDFEKKVTAWDIQQTTDEPKAPFPMMALTATAKDAQKRMDENKKAAGAYSLEHLAEWDKVSEAKKKGAPVPPGLKAVADKYEEFSDIDRKARKQIAEAKDAIEKEKRIMQKSLGTIEGLEGLQGELSVKKLVLSLTVEGQAKTYAMTLRKYELAPDSTTKVLSRWMIHDLTPQ